MAAAGNEWRVLRPRDATDLADVVREHPRALEPVGGGTKRTIGCPVDADALDLSALTGIVAYEPAELVLTARAATPLRAIAAELGRHGQRLAFEPPDFGTLLSGVGGRHMLGGALGEAPTTQTLGGVLASNLSGSRRVSAGAARDHFLGFHAVTGTGQRFKAGGRVVKNVTGYDLPKLLAGSWGTLAVLTEVTVRVSPAPETEATLLLPSRTPAEAVATMTAALSSPHDVSAAAFDPARGGSALRIEGFEASVAARVRGVRELLGREAERLDPAASRAYWDGVGAAVPLADAPIVWRISVPPADAPRVVAALGLERYLLDWGGGLIWAAQHACDAARVRAAVREGHATLWKAPRDVRVATEVFQPRPAPLAAVAARIKAAFDPGNKLNPGRMGQHSSAG